jgi:hypothetical protein
MGDGLRCTRKKCLWLPFAGMHNGERMDLAAAAARMAAQVEGVMGTPPRQPQLPANASKAEVLVNAVNRWMDVLLESGREHLDILAPNTWWVTDMVTSNAWGAEL